MSLFSSLNTVSAGKNLSMLFTEPALITDMRSSASSLPSLTSVDLTKKDAPVKSAADGTVIFSEWTTQTGYVIIIEHSNNLISVYKHNSQLSKEQGTLVKAGEVIATAGNTGELSTGPHLHFELWSDGYPIDPTNFIDFE